MFSAGHVYRISQLLAFAVMNASYDDNKSILRGIVDASQFF
jgi:hypothetical protein